MPSGDLGKISVEVEARIEKLEQGLAKALKKTKEAAEKAEKASKFDFAKGAADDFFKIVGTLGKVELGLRAVTAVSQAFAGDMEHARENLERLPLGIGPVISAYNGLIDVISGAAKEQEKLNKLTKELADRRAAITGSVEASKQLGAIGTTPDPVAQIEAQRDAALKDVESLNSLDPAKFKEYVSARKRIIDAANTAIERQMQKEADTIREMFAKGAAEQQRREDDLAEERKQQNEKRIAAEKQWAKEIDAVAKQNAANFERRVQEQRQREDEEFGHRMELERLLAEERINNLEKTGQKEAAALEKVNASYRERIKMAERAGETEKVAVLKRLQAQAQARIADQFAEKGLEQTTESAQQFRAVRAGAFDFGAISALASAQARRPKVALEGPALDTLRQIAVNTSNVHAARAG